MKSFPFTPKHTVVFFPSRMNVKTSPYCDMNQHRGSRREGAKLNYLFSTTKEELVRVNAISDSAPKEGYPVKDQRRLIGIFEEQLVEDVEDNGKHHNGECSSSNDNSGRPIRQKVAQWLGEGREEPHDYDRK